MWQEVAILVSKNLWQSRDAGGPHDGIIDVVPEKCDTPILEDQLESINKRREIFLGRMQSKW